MDSQTSIFVYGRRSWTADDDMSTSGTSVAVCGVGFHLPQEFEASIEARNRAVSQRLLEVVYQTLEDGAEINYRGEEARVGLYMSMKSADMADAASGSDVEEPQKENHQQLDEMRRVTQYFGLHGPR